MQLQPGLVSATYCLLLRTKQRPELTRPISNRIYLDEKHTIQVRWMVVVSSARGRPPSIGRSAGFPLIYTDLEASWDSLTDPRGDSVPSEANRTDSLSTLPHKGRLCTIMRAFLKLNISASSSQQGDTQSTVYLQIQLLDHLLICFVLCHF